jgi:hypothetical protein
MSHYINITRSYTRKCYKYITELKSVSENVLYKKRHQKIQIKIQNENQALTSNY